MVCLKKKAFCISPGLSGFKCPYGKLVCYRHASLRCQYPEPEIKTKISRKYNKYFYIVYILIYVVITYDISALYQIGHCHEYLSLPLNHRKTYRKPFVI